MGIDFWMFWCCHTPSSFTWDHFRFVDDGLVEFPRVPVYPHSYVTFRLSLFSLSFIMKNHSHLYITAQVCLLCCARTRSFAEPPCSWQGYGLVRVCSEREVFEDKLEVHLRCSFYPIYTVFMKSVFVSIFVAMSIAKSKLSRKWRVSWNATMLFALEKVLGYYLFTINI